MKTIKSKFATVAFALASTFMAGASHAQVTEQTGEAAGVDLVVAGFGLHLWTRRLECFY